ncbi:hypothetical protein LguiA_033180 [Lonicera macranthoides]
MENTTPPRIERLIFPQVRLLKQNKAVLTFKIARLASPLKKSRKKDVPREGNTETAPFEIPRVDHGVHLSDAAPSVDVTAPIFSGAVTSIKGGSFANLVVTDEGVRVPTLKIEGDISPGPCVDKGKAKSKELVDVPARPMIEAGRKHDRSWNQIPFFVLNGLFQLAFPSDQEEMLFLKCSIDYFSNFMLIKDDDKLFNKVKVYLKTTGFEVKHFVDLLRICLYTYDSYIRDYVFFMHMFMDTPKDAELLIQNEIIENCLGDSKAVVTLFNKVGYEVLINDSSYYFFDISEKINAYCIVTRHTWMATFKRDYCSTPMRIASTIVAIIENWLGDSKAIVTLFNKVGYEVLIDDSAYYFSNISKKINAYHSVTRHTWKATFKRDYCSTPMMIASTIVTVVLFVLTVMQTQKPGDSNDAGRDRDGSFLFTGSSPSPIHLTSHGRPRTE